MAEEEFGQTAGEPAPLVEPLAAASTAPEAPSYTGPVTGGIWPTSTPPEALGDVAEEFVKAPHFSSDEPDVKVPSFRSGQPAEDIPAPSKREQFRDVFDFMVGITPDRLVNAIGFTAQDAIEATWTKAAGAVKGVIRGDPADLPKIAKNGNGKGSGIV